MNLCKHINAATRIGYLRFGDPSVGECDTAVRKVGKLMRPDVRGLPSRVAYFCLCPVLCDA